MRSRQRDRSSGVSKRDLLDRNVSKELDALMDQKLSYRWGNDTDPLPAVDSDKYLAAAASPVISQGNVIGAVVMLRGEGGAFPDDSEVKLIQVSANFIARHMES